MAVKLVFGFLVGEAGAEFVEGAIGRRQNVAGLEFAGRRRLDQVLGDFADALLEAGLLGLPGAAAQPVELRAIVFRAVAGEQFDVFDGQEQPVIAGIDEQQAIMGCALHFDGLQAFEAANAVIDMDDEIARRERGELREEIAALRFLRALRIRRSPRMSCSAMTARSLVSKPSSRPSTTRLTMDLSRVPASAQVGGAGQRRQFMVLQDGVQALLASLRSNWRSPRACRTCAGLRYGASPRHRCLAGLGAFGGKAAAAPAAK